jgi:hypothetical protein
VLLERRYHALESLRRCARADELAPGWWSGRSLPLPFGERVTGRLDTPGGPILIRNGTPELEEFVTWVMERFVRAGLPPPRVRTVAFDPFARRCSGLFGYTEGRRGKANILICADAAVGSGWRDPRDPACRDLDCPEVNRGRRALLLHELGHAWLISHFDARKREEFMRHVGVEAWSGDTSPPTERGVEWAASIIAWGLGGNEPTLPEGEGWCDHLRRGYRILTDAEPLVECGQD